MIKICWPFFKLRYFGTWTFDVRRYFKAKFPRHATGARRGARGFARVWESFVVAPLLSVPWTFLA